MSPYALAKSISFDIAKIYRTMFGINVCCGILFNHESILRDNNYVIKKISYSINKILKNNKNKIKLGNIKISRDWGWAPEYVKIIWKIMNNNYDTEIPLFFFEKNINKFKFNGGHRSNDENHRGWRWKSTHINSNLFYRLVKPVL